MRYLIIIVGVSASLLAMEQKPHSSIFEDAVLLDKKGEEVHLDYTKALIPYSPVSFAHMRTQHVPDELPAHLIEAPKRRLSVTCESDSTQVLALFSAVSPDVRAFAVRHGKKLQSMRVSKELTWTYVFNVIFGCRKKKNVL